MDRRIPIHMTNRARKLRKESPYCERVLWRLLRSREMDGLKFRRQHVIDFFVVDFYCAEAQLIIEVDGPTHDPEEDAKRDAYLQEQGLEVLRFTNDDVLKGRRFVIDRIWDCAMKRRACSDPHPDPLPGRERE